MSEMISECCGASEWFTDSGICGDCKEHSEFINENDLNEDN